MIKNALFLVICLAIFLIIVQAAAVAIYTKRIDYKAYKPFEQVRPDADLNILILGDSTAAGVGSLDPKQTTAGRFGALYPHANVENISANGLKLETLRPRLQEMKKEHYDLVVMQIGANDIMRLTPFDSMEESLRSIIRILRPRADHIIMLHSADIGTAAMFTWPFTKILSYRSYRTRELYKKVAADTGAMYVDLIAENTDNVFKHNINKYYAPDHLHLSGEGCGIWYNAIRETMKSAKVTI